uniref:Probable G-protein coupled receptor 160 n=1 Tax=Pogona vitticeps TaxID=103695 RepID=A0A6J0TLS3_9SAUR
MATVLCENCTFLCLQPGCFLQPSEASGALLLIMLGKVSFNLYLLRARRQTVRDSFMGYFCISLAFFDLVLLVTMSFISYFQNIMLLGVYFTKYHICLLAQIMAFTYGLLHYPVFIATGLDYYLTITHTSKNSSVRCSSLYVFAVTFLWISVLCYVLNLPGNTIGLDVNYYSAAHQCPFYISSQTYWLSLGMLFITCLVLVSCWSEVMNTVQSVKITSIRTESVFFFPYVPECSRRSCAKHLLTRLLICFMGTWAPFLFLQTLIILLGAQIPAFIEMNVPWLYFINSFLIAITCWLRRQHMELTEESWDVDPFVSWKYCFVPFSYQDVDEAQKPITKIVVY